MGYMVYFLPGALWEINKTEDGNVSYVGCCSFLISMVLVNTFLPWKTCRTLVTMCKSPSQTQGPRAVSLVIADDHFDLFLKGLCGFVWVRIHTLLLLLSTCRL